LINSSIRFFDVCVTTTRRWNDGTAAARNIDPSDANSRGSIIEDQSDEKMQREIEDAINSIRDEQARGRADDLTSAESRERRNHAQTLNILNEMCGFAPIDPTSSATVRCGDLPAFVAGSATAQLDADHLRELKDSLNFKPNPDVASSNGAAAADDMAGTGRLSDSNSGVHLRGGSESTAAAAAALPQAQCTQEQADALETVMTWLRADQQRRVGGHDALVPHTPLLLIHGPGGAPIALLNPSISFYWLMQRLCLIVLTGSGKSFFAQRLMQESARATGSARAVQCCAPTGLLHL
jgi:hypothetical protein